MQGFPIDSIMILSNLKGLVGMARKPKNIVPISDQIEQLDADIQKAENRLKELKTKRKELLAKKEEEEISELRAAIDASGKSVEQVIVWLRSENS